MLLITLCESYGLLGILQRFCCFFDLGSHTLQYLFLKRQVSSYNPVSRDGHQFVANVVQPTPSNFYILFKYFAVFIKYLEIKYEVQSDTWELLTIFLSTGSSLVFPCKFFSLEDNLIRTNIVLVVRRM
jgi:hypothetical protein